MIHNVHLIQRRLEGKSNANLLPFVLASLLMLATGIVILINFN